MDADLEKLYQRKASSTCASSNATIRESLSWLSIAISNDIELEASRKPGQNIAATKHARRTHSFTSAPPPMERPAATSGNYDNMLKETIAFVTTPKRIPRRPRPIKMVRQCFQRQTAGRIVTFGTSRITSCFSSRKRTTPLGCRTLRRSQHRHRRRHSANPDGNPAWGAKPICNTDVFLVRAAGRHAR